MKKDKEKTKNMHEMTEYVNRIRNNKKERKKNKKFDDDIMYRISTVLKMVLHCTRMNKYVFRNKINRVYH